jgi:hypothetical protein
MQQLFETNQELGYYFMAGVARQYKTSMDTRAKMILKTLARHPEMKPSIQDIEKLTPAY